MSLPKQVMDDESLAQARQLVAELESGNSDGASQLLDDLARRRDSGLFQELGKITRELHNTLNGFQLDSRIASLTENDIPDAKERLNYVITMTEQAAHRTLNAVEESLPVAEELKSRSEELHTKWRRFRQKDMDVGEFRALVPELDSFLDLTSGHAVKLHESLSDVMMAQDFQDITGQIIRRVINLVKDVEDNLVGLIRISGQRMVQTEKPAAKASDLSDELSRGIGPQVPGLDHADVAKNQDDVDDLLSSLGF
ncbi:MAG: protein phosphatase CheZ [Gammaproteobacteria bacterium]|nr:protein phosphatase CheZ [Gammaproteobacteria bacterium]MBU2479381.1 protein phosphatase CheZ [Gammaproteobacteria bacterium]